jgi:hypothetical protein
MRTGGASRGNRFVGTAASSYWYNNRRADKAKPIVPDPTHAPLWPNDQGDRRSPQRAIMTMGDEAMGDRAVGHLALGGMGKPMKLLPMKILL